MSRRNRRDRLPQTERQTHQAPGAGGPETPLGHLDPGMLVPPTPDPEKPLEQSAKPEAVFEWPRCGYCGSLALRESRRGGLRERMLRLSGCTLYRCENCERRFAFSTLGHPHRHHGERVRLRHRGSLAAEEPIVRGPRRYAFGLLATLLAALFTFFAAGWLISRAERSRLESESTPPPR